MFSRYIAIVIAFGAALLQGSRGNWIETAGLVGLGAGLVLLRLSTPDPFSPRGQQRGAPLTPAPRPALRWFAWACFAVTAAAFIAVARRTM